MMVLDRDAVRAAVYGGAVLGGGGGGWVDLGLDTGNLAVAIDRLCLYHPSELDAATMVATVSAVGAPAATGRYVTPRHFVRAVEILRDGLGVAVGGLITNENGGSATVNGWVQAAVLGLRVIDAPCNGRAHPTGVMGSLGLHRVAGYQSRQAAVGGDPDRGQYLELAVTGGLQAASAMVRQASVQAGGVVAVARNPVTLEYAREHGAPGAVSQAIKVGRAILEHEGHPTRMLEAAAMATNGEIMATSAVSRLRLETSGGFDAGEVEMESGHVLTFWNEYMTLDLGDQRLGTFPDLIMTLDARTGLPITTAEVRQGQLLAVLWAHRKNLILGAGMRDAALFAPAEAAVGKKLVEHVF
ncbi:MAG: DUF917 family protein [Bacillota bacterium]